MLEVGMKRRVIQLSMSSSSDPRRTRWQYWNRTAYWQTAMIGLFVVILILQLAGNIFDWVYGVEGRRIHEF
jgi:hypothetical protein